MKKESTRGQKATKGKRPIHRVKRVADPAMNPATACYRHHEKHLNPDVARHAAQCMGVFSEAPEFEMK